MSHTHSSIRGTRGGRVDSPTSVDGESEVVVGGVVVAACQRQS